MLWLMMLALMQEPTLADRLNFCAEEQDSLRRLACYDLLAKGDNAEGGEADPLAEIPLAEDFDVEMAIKAGLAKKRGGLHMIDQMAGFGSTSGFSLRVHSPKTWVQSLAWEAADKFLPFSADELEEGDFKDVLRIVVYPDTPDKVTDSNLASGVKHVVIRDARKKEAIQPLVVEEFGETVQNAMGAELDYQGATAIFDMAEVQRIRALDSKKEFHISVVGHNFDKDFKIKTKHFDDLGWPKR